VGGEGRSAHHAGGRWLRRLRLDERPQLFNLIRGDYRQRLCVTPEVTGWTQINHKYGDTVEDAITKLEYDLYYIRNLAPSLDAYNGVAGPRRAVKSSEGGDRRFREHTP